MRIITLPLFRVGLVTGIILCLARSLLETGGTYIVLKILGVQNTFFTEPTYIKIHISGGDGPLILTSSVMIIAVLLLFLVKWMVMRFHIKNEAVWLELSRKFSRGAVSVAKNVLFLLFMSLVVLIPSFYIFAYLIEPCSIDTGALMSAMGTSFLVMGVAVVFDIVFGIPVVF